MSLLHIGGWVRFCKGNKVPWKDNLEKCCEDGRWNCKAAIYVKVISPFIKDFGSPWDYKDNTFEHYLLSEFHNNYFPIYKITNKHILEVIKLTNRNTKEDAYQETYLKEVNERIRVWK